MEFVDKVKPDALTHRITREFTSKADGSRS